MVRSIVMYEFWYDYLKSTYGEKAKLCYMDTENDNGFIVIVKTDDIYKDIIEDVETSVDTSNYDLSRLLPRGKIKNVFSLMKDELGGRFIRGFVEL